MTTTIFDKIPEGFMIELHGPFKDVWSCEIFNLDETIKFIEYGDSAEHAVKLCLDQLCMIYFKLHATI